MRGEILGYDANNDTGVIVSEGKRYKFGKENWRENTLPVKGAKVDFINQGERAEDIYLINGYAAGDSSLTILALISLGITFLFGFAGTLISRMAISKHSFSQALPATAVHLVITVLAVIPVIGWIIYVIGTAYFMVKNYRYVINPEGENPYA